MKFNSAFVLAGSASSALAGVGGVGVVDYASTTDIATKRIGVLRSAAVVADVSHAYQHSVASAAIGRAVYMDNNMVMVQGELKREIRSQQNDQWSHMLQDAEDTTVTVDTTEEGQVEDEDFAVLCMGGLTKFSDLVRGWFANRQQTSSGGEAGGLRN